MAESPARDNRASKTASFRMRRIQGDLESCPQYHSVPAVHPRLDATAVTLIDWKVRSASAQ
jgi:hypothetical protein